jgi:hypothetical protein
MCRHLMPMLAFLSPVAVAAIPPKGTPDTELDGRAQIPIRQRK